MLLLNQSFKRSIFLFCFVLLGTKHYSQSYKDMMNDPQYNIYEVIDEAEKYFNAMSVEEKYAKGSGWKGYQRWRHENEYKYFPSGDRRNIDPFLTAKAFKRFKTQFPIHKRARENTRNNIPEWIDLGPYTIGQVTGHYAVGLGRVESFYVDPTGQYLYLGSRSGGFWKSTDGGSSWAGGITDTMIASGVNTLTVRPNNKDQILINIRNAQNGTTHGIYQSIDGGNEWNITNFNPVNLGWGGLGSNRQIYEIQYHPTIANLVFIGTNNGLYRSTNDLVSWNRYLSSLDINKIVFHPTNSDIIYAAASNDKSSIYVSIDGGINWAPSSLPGNTSNIRLSVSPDCSNCVFVGTSDGIWKSINNGTTFTKVSSPGINNFGAFAVSDIDTSIMLFGDIDTHISTDGGRTFIKRTFWSQGNASYAGNDKYVHADIRGARCINGKFWTNTDGFLCKSLDNAGVTWARFEGQGIRENYNLGVSQSNHDRTISGSQDNGTSILTENGWVEFYGADGMEGFVHPLNDDWIIGSLQNGGRRRTLDGGMTQRGVTPPNQEAYWIAPIFCDPNNPMTVYSLGINVHKSEDFGSTWNVMGTPNFTGVIKYAAIAENNSKIMVAARNQNIEISKDGGLTFSSIRSNLPNYSITDVVFDPNDDHTMVVTYGRYNNDNSKVYITTDQGATWQNITYNLGNMPVRCAAIDHTPDGNIYLGTEIGVYVKSKSETTWQLFNEALPNVSVREMEINHGSNTLRAATWGRGLWEQRLRYRENHPRILTTEISDLPTFENPASNIPQFVTVNLDPQIAASEVYVKYSTDTATFDYLITMSSSQGSAYISDEPIPGFNEGTKVFFKVYAVGSPGDTTETYRFMYTTRRARVLSEGEEWKYADAESEPSPQNGILWFDVNYNDDAWLSGNGQLGYGDGDETTVINNNAETAYFRKSIQIPNPGLYGDIKLKLLYDDGAIAYVNGEEVWRVNMAPGPVGYSTRSISESQDNAIAEYTLLNPMVKGENVIAVEVHQRSSSSSDISFDLSITADPCNKSEIVKTVLDFGNESLRTLVSRHCSGDTLSFAQSISNDTIRISEGSIPINKDLVISGTNVSETIISGENLGRIFDILNPNVEVVLENLTIVKGRSLQDGGAILNRGKLRLKNVTFKDNMEDGVPKSFSNKGEVTILPGTTRISED